MKTAILTLASVLIITAAVHAIPGQGQQQAAPKPTGCDYFNNGIVLDATPAALDDARKVYAAGVGTLSGRGVVSRRPVTVTFSKGETLLKDGAQVEVLPAASNITATWGIGSPGVIDISLVSN